ncbi:MAG: cupin domain-containing protein [Armatimonadota bacterium]|nr:cupin domain-containing protein [Armatimonadota bacterium]MDR5688439.1 cupin domain-containing protein [Armatimonadota bacterium]MDR7387132.1 cupin domain-containing protein [Armatimonadota bacterium]MDR7388956.1 cupin domain-containing protein [Armatimonadota bacterium]MDR7390463.1 cupin domain-containing protein [Armatimonadota bacterium]
MLLLKPERGKAGAPERPQDFAGPVWMQALRRTDQPGAVEVVAVFFEEGARTRPHVHSTDQVLVFLEGEGVVATETERRVVQAGEVVWVPAGTWHWHGANKGRSCCHLSIKPPGPTDWNAPLRDWEDW